MADVADTIQEWSTTRSSNQPQGSTTVGTGWDDNLREIQGVVRGALASKGADIASAATTDLGAVEGLFHDITGTTTITGFGTVSAGIWKVVKFEGVLTLTHNATSLILLAGANRTTADGDVGIYISEGSGNWRELAYAYAGAITMDTHPIVMGSSDRTKKVRLEVDGLTTGTTRVLTVQDSDDTLVGRATTDTLTNKTLTAPALNGALSGDAIAAQAEMETATATDSIVSPGNLQYHPLVPKAWAMFNGSTAGTNAPTAGSGITSITRNGTGDYTVNFSITWSAANYAFFGTAESSGGTTLRSVLKSTGGTYTTSAFQFYCQAVSDTSSAAQADSNFISIFFFGDL